MQDYSVPVHKSLTRPQMIVGCDRELYLSLLLFVAILIGPAGLFDGRFFTAFIGAVIWVLGTFGLAQMAKKDPHARQTYLRSLRYRSFYPATEYVYEAEPERRRW